ncbi:hypothetical protein DEI81_15165 [Curtobacterium sp. MCBD17_013]|uniref:nucleoside deaminase n=1 Tax=Curtobacterium sp. MCBD17_013 TaxID=2175668 RepID=UPI000DA811D5|nr:nucleoside deaminase [Curtobacterium sp. MCBD17_013]PZF57898.1 hypothetical protein DEI81_15165 [Curtobacterium sp. MCBD17_013]
MTDVEEPAEPREPAEPQEPTVRHPGGDPRDRATGLPAEGASGDAAPSAVPGGSVQDAAAASGLGAVADDPATAVGPEPVGAGPRFTTAEEQLAVARAEAEQGLVEGGIPIGAALFAADGTLLGSGHNRRVQDDDASMHAETNAFRNAGRQPGYSGTTMVTTLSPCWYCSGLVKQFGISRVVIGEAETFSGGHDWLREQGVEVTILDDPDLVAMMRTFIAEEPTLWNEDIGVE